MEQSPSGSEGPSNRFELDSGAPSKEPAVWAQLAPPTASWFRPMKRYPRKVTPRVVDGKVQRKNRAAPTPTYWNTPQDLPVLDRRRPGAGYRHLITKQDLAKFIALLPDWAGLSKGLNAVVLAPGEPWSHGWHTAGVVGLCAWERELRQCVHREYYREHREILKRLEVPVERIGDAYHCQFDEAAARAFQLLHVFLHELGHHHDRMATRSKRQASRGESYAEQYARQHEDVIWDRYFEVFPRERMRPRRRRERARGGRGGLP